MRKHACFALAALVPLTLVCSWSYATPDDDYISREEFEKRMAEFRQALETRDATIAGLQSQLQGDDAASVKAHAEARETQLSDLLAEVDSAQAANPLMRNPVSFNPDIAVVTDFLATAASRGASQYYNRFDVREAELDIRAAVDPRADGVVILAFARDVDNPVFPEGTPLEGPDTSVDVEEAYLFLHDFGIKNLTAKVGRFHLRFGRQNILHLHDLPTSDPPFVNQAFLAPEALSDSGLSLSYLVPNPWNQYLEAVVEVITGEGAGSESPTLGGDLNVDSPAINAHLLWNTDLGGGWNAELGGSWLLGHADSDNMFTTQLFGGDLTVIHTDPTGGSNNLLLQAEFIHGMIDQEDGSTSRAWGAYFLAQQQLSKDWYAGTRFDWTENPFDASQETWGVTPYVSWYWSEFLRFRLSYQHRGGDVPDTDVVMLQITWIFGAHPPHPYWAMH